MDTHSAVDLGSILLCLPWPVCGTGQIHHLAETKTCRLIPARVGPQHQ